MNTLDTLLNRKSVRSYTGEAPSQEELDRILLAAQASPVGKGKYDEVHLTVIKSTKMLEKIDEAAAKMTGRPGRRALYGAPLLILVSAKAPVAGSENVTYSNAAIIVHDMILEAVELGLGAVHIWGAIRGLSASQELVSELGLPEGFIPCCAAAIGKTGETYSLRDIKKDRIGVSYI